RERGPVRHDIRWATTLAMLLLLPAGARAQITQEPVSPHPDPSKFARGLYGEAEVGTLVFVGEAGGTVGPGAVVGARFGYDFLRWVALQVHAAGSTHTTKFRDMPQTGQILQLYQGSAELKLTVRFGQFAVA